MTRLVESVGSAQAMERLAAGLSAFAQPGSAILLRGELGAGKSVFARAFIRALSGSGPELEVPSPTFTLVQTYEDTRIPAAHADLYRLSTPPEAQELGLEELLRSHVLLVEWPDRCGALDVPNVLDVAITGHGDERTLTFEGSGTWAVALERNRLIEKFLATTEWKDARRVFLEGDASFRRYEALVGENAPNAILMDMQARPDGPPVKNGKSYSAIAHLGEDIRSVIAVNTHLCACGYSAPKTQTFDIGKGLAVIENLGSRVYGAMRQAGEDMHEPMRAAVAILADMAGRSWPAHAAIGDGTFHAVPNYDSEAQLIEVDLLPGWFWPYLHNAEVPIATRAAFAAAWSEVLPLTIAQNTVWVLRDYHSPNLLWLPGRHGMKRVGLIDTQDCLLGHPAYDLASLLQDARVDISGDEEAELFGYYCDLRARQGAFDRAAFTACYSILGAQRATKILGIFARLSKRDGKHGYLRHLPRVSRCLERNLGHAALLPVCHWYEKHLPQGVREARR